MTRIFLTLASVSTMLLVVVFLIGLNIDDPKLPEAQSLISWHMMLALSGLVFAALVHALVLTYFMGTGRWMEDVSKAYQLDSRFQEETKQLKYRSLQPVAVVCHNRFWCRRRSRLQDGLCWLGRHNSRNVPHADGDRDYGH